jgi:ribosomal-protein-alanine N-acetyltransferase
MMKLLTPRMELLALDPAWIHQWITDLPNLEAMLHLRYVGEELTEDFCSIIEHQSQSALADEPHSLWHTFWWFVLPAENIVIGSACFKSAPQNGHVEIGYGIAPAFENHGYTTEAICALCTFAFCDPTVDEVWAETEPDNLASQRVLRKIGMTIFKEEASSIWWHLVSPK